MTSVRWKSLATALVISGAATLLVQSNAFGLVHTSVLTILVVSPGLFVCGLIGFQSDWALVAISFALNFVYYFGLLKLVQLWLAKVSEND
jgi:hypothetical protein